MGPLRDESSILELMKCLRGGNTLDANGFCGSLCSNLNNKEFHFVQMNFDGGHDEDSNFFGICLKSE